MQYAALNYTDFDHTEQVIVPPPLGILPSTAVLYWRQGI